MTKLNRTPKNIDLLQPTKYLLTFDRIGDVQYFCQEINLPGIDLNSLKVNFPGQDVYAPGNKLTWNPLVIKFLINEDMSSWMGLYEWFKSIASPQGTTERNYLRDKQNEYRTSLGDKYQYYSDATLTVLSALNNPIIRIKYINVFPTSLDDLNFNTMLSADDIMTSTCTFIYDYYEFEKI